MKLEIELATLKNTIRTTTEIHYRGVQVEGQIPKTRETSFYFVCGTEAILPLEVEIWSLRVSLHGVLNDKDYIL